MANQFSWERFQEVPIVGILRGFHPDTAFRLVECAQQGGLLNVEITMNSPSAEAVIAETAARFGNDMNVGVGTVCTLEELNKALAAGASFVITPALLPEIIAECRTRGVPIFPGAFTPTEILQAWNGGADIVKVFPAAGLGPSYFKDVGGPFPQIRLMPTGGVTVDTLGDFYRAGAVAFSVGSQLFDKGRVAAGDWQWITDRCKAFVDAYQQAKQPAEASN